jgi:hypothetical protein
MPTVQSCRLDIPVVISSVNASAQATRQLQFLEAELSLEQIS